MSWARPSDEATARICDNDRKPISLESELRNKSKDLAKWKDGLAPEGTKVDAIINEIVKVQEQIDKSSDFLRSSDSRLMSLLSLS